MSDRWKALIERLEPGVHQFFPMTVKSRNTVMGEMHYLVICNRINGLDHAACVPPIKSRDRSYRPSFTPADRLVLNKAAIQGFHLWKDKYYIHTWTSNDFHEAFLAEGLVGLSDSRHLDEVG